MRALVKHSIFLGLVGLVWALAVACYGFDWFADPYELRFPRQGIRLAEHPYPSDIVPRLIPAALLNHADVVILGASTSMGYTTAMMRKAFPAARNPINLSFSCADTDDMRRILPRLERSPDVRRVIINLDVTLIYVCEPPRSQSALDPRYLRHDWYDPAPEFSLEALKLIRAERRTHVLDLPGWRPRFPGRVDGMADEPPMTFHPDLMAELATQVDEARPRVTAGADLPCDQAPAIREVIAPFVRRLAARGVAVDLVAPPYSLAIWSPWTLDPSRFPAGPFVSVMALQRCALEATAGAPNVRFYGLDTDASIVGNLGYYRDVAHLADNRIYQEMLDRIAAGQDVLTPADWPYYEARLRREIDAFHIVRSPVAPRSAQGAGAAPADLAPPS